MIELILVGVMMLMCIVLLYALFIEEKKSKKLKIALDELTKENINLINRLHKVTKK